MKKSLRLLLIAPFAAIALAATGFANPIVGSISFIGSPDFNSSSIATATAFSGYDYAFVSPLNETGNYVGVPTLTPVTFKPFTFSPAQQVVDPLWSFTVAGTTYSFTTSTTTASFDAALNIWNVGGTGIAHITGFDDTWGTWNLSAGAVGSSLYFGSAEASTGRTIHVPETGSTILLIGLGLGLVGISALPRNRKLVA